MIQLLDTVVNAPRDNVITWLLKPRNSIWVAGAMSSRITGLCGRAVLWVQAIARHAINDCACFVACHVNDCVIVANVACFVFVAFVARDVKT